MIGPPPFILDFDDFENPDGFAWWWLQRDPRCVRTTDADELDAQVENLARMFEEVVRLRESTWHPVDLAPVLSGERVAVRPTVLRIGKQWLLYRAKVNEIHSESEAGKSWLALVAVVQEISQFRHVGYVDCEDDEISVVGRLLELGARPEQIRECFHYIAPGEPLDPEMAEFLEALVRSYRMTLVVIDGMTEVQTLVAEATGGEDANIKIARFMSILPRRLARAGAAVLLLDHVPKSRNGGLRYAIGSVHKLNAVSGASYALENKEPLGRGRTGLSVIIRAKDRPGRVEFTRVGSTYQVAEVEFISRPHGDGFAMTIQSLNSENATVKTPQSTVEARRAVSHFLESEPNKWHTQTDIETNVTGGVGSLRAAAEWLAAHGFAEFQERARRSKNYRHLNKFEEGGDV